MMKFEFIIPLIELFPALNLFIEESGLENEIKLNFPPCPYAELEEDDFYFFMENMKENGYTEEVDKKLGLNFINILRVPFAQIIFCPKITEPKAKHKEKRCSKLFRIKKIIV